MLIVVCNTCGKRVWDMLSQEEIIARIWIAAYFDCSDCIEKEIKRLQQEDPINNET